MRDQQLKERLCKYDSKGNLKLDPITQKCTASHYKSMSGKKVSPSKPKEGSRQSERTKDDKPVAGFTSIPLESVNLRNSIKESDEFETNESGEDHQMSATAQRRSTQMDGSPQVRTGSKMLYNSKSTQFSKMSEFGKFVFARNEAQQKRRYIPFQRVPTVINMKSQLTRPLICSRKFAHSS